MCRNPRCPLGDRCPFLHDERLLTAEAPPTNYVARRCPFSPSWRECPRRYFCWDYHLDDPSRPIEALWLICQPFPGREAEVPQNANRGPLETGPYGQNLIIFPDRVVFPGSQTEHQPPAAVLHLDGINFTGGGFVLPLQPEQVRDALFRPSLGVLVPPPQQQQSNFQGVFNHPWPPGGFLPTLQASVFFPHLQGAGVFLRPPVPPPLHPQLVQAPPQQEAVPGPLETGPYYQNLIIFPDFDFSAFFAGLQTEQEPPAAVPVDGINFSGGAFVLPLQQEQVRDALFRPSLGALVPPPRQQQTNFRGVFNHPSPPGGFLSTLQASVFSPHPQGAGVFLQPPVPPPRHPQLVQGPPQQEPVPNLPGHNFIIGVFRLSGTDFFLRLPAPQPPGPQVVQAPPPRGLQAAIPHRPEQNIRSLDPGVFHLQLQVAAPPLPLAVAAGPPSPPSAAVATPPSTSTPPSSSQLLPHQQPEQPAPPEQPQPIIPAVQPQPHQPAPAQQPVQPQPILPPVVEEPELQAMDADIDDGADADVHVAILSAYYVLRDA